MTIKGLYRAVLEWAVEPIASAGPEDPSLENASLETTLWHFSSRELADLPIGPEPAQAPPAVAPEPSSSRRA